MVQSEIILYIIKLLLGGVAAFFAIMLWSRTRDTAWMSLVAGTIISYAGIVYEMLNEFDIYIASGITLFGIPIAELLFTIIPPIFYIAAFIMMLQRTKK